MNPLKGYKDETQNRFELDSFLGFLSSHNIQTYAEIGVYAGSTFLEVYKTMKRYMGLERFTMLCIEYPTNQRAFAHLQSVVLEEIRADPQVDLHVFIGNSTEEKVVKGVFDVMNGKRAYSLVFIDGDHSFDQSFDDYMAYKGMFNFVGFNDIARGTSQKNRMKHGHDVATVSHLWRALTCNLPSMHFEEYEDTTADNPRGIGILL